MPCSSHHNLGVVKVSHIISLWYLSVIVMFWLISINVRISGTKAPNKVTATSTDHDHNKPNQWVPLQLGSKWLLHVVRKLSQNNNTVTQVTQQKSGVQQSQAKRFTQVDQLQKLPYTNSNTQTNKSKLPLPQHKIGTMCGLQCSKPATHTHCDL